ncbi:hypothetical protein BGZ76_004295 [Entomortierella beljakovae]|nr:hypothetical protein BGZ76_004295 [Entomortierella beljakovae]
MAPTNCVPLISIFDIPHILLGIMEHLSGNDIRSCSLVCHSWSIFLAPMTWTKFNLGERDYESLLTNPTTKDLFNKRMPTIRELTIQCHESQRYFGSYLQRKPNLFVNQLTYICYTSPYFSYGDYGTTTKPISSLNNYYITERAALTESLLLSLVERNSETLLHLEIWLNDWNNGFVTQLCNNLWKLKVLKTAVFKGNPDTIISIRPLCLIFQEYPSTLESLEISYALESNPEYIMPVTPYFSADERITGNIMERWSTVSQSKLQKLILPRNRWHERYFQETTDPVILNLLQHRCENLKEFVFPLMKTNLPVLTRSLSPCTNLRHLEFEGIPSDMVQIYATAIKVCQQLESIAVSGRVSNAQPIVSSVISAHASRIKRIKWTGGGGFDRSLDLEEFMRSCSSLEWLGTTYGSYHGFIEQGAVGGFRISDKPLPAAATTTTTSSVSDLDLRLNSLTLEESSSSNLQAASSPSPSTSDMVLLNSLPTRPTSSLPQSSYWACCSTLTFLDVSFYPDVTVPDEQQFKNQVEHMYIKLGQLHALEKLYIGCKCRCFGPHLVYCVHSRPDYEYGDPEIVEPPAPIPIPEGWATRFPPEVLNAGAKDDPIFDMSLSSGLGHLSGLKNLRLLNISKIFGHKVGYKELEWMKENWPNLREFYGTRNSRIGEWIMQNWPSLL